MSKLSKEKIKAACDKVRREVSAMSPELRQQLERKARQVIAKGKTGTLLSDLEALAAGMKDEANTQSLLRTNDSFIRQECAQAFESALRALIQKHAK